MILNFLFAIAGVFLNIIYGILSLFNFVMPPFVAETFSYFFGFFQILGDLLPINIILIDFCYFVQFLILWYGFKLAYWLVKHIPFFPKNTKVNLSKE